jgi:blue copper oxidase
MVRIRLIKQPIFFTTLAILLFNNAFSQNPLTIPPVLTGLNFNLTVQAGTQPFYPGNPTPTYGINGAFLSPTIVVNKGDIVTLNVVNTLNVATTMHWHGLHVAPENDGGPHQSIAAGSTWSPSFEILNNAGTYWYHPHGEGKTELHVGKGLSGLFIVHDPTELSLGLPQTYGVDDIPLIVQTKAFDVLHQIAIADHMDTAVFVNGTLHATTDLPAQVVRLRLLNGSSMRSFYFGFSNNMTFYQIATDGGLVAAPNAVTRLLVAPGERSEVLVNLSGMNGQSVDLMSYASEMPVGVFGSPAVGVSPDTMEMYDENFLNGADFQLVEFNIVAQNASPVTSIPASLVAYTPFDVADLDVNRTLVFDTITLVPGSVPNLAEGPFGINATTFNMDSINITIPLNSTEVWTLKNNTHIAHPFHIHDVQFNVIEKSGTPPPITEQGWKDVVLVMPHDSVKFITQFTTFTDEMVPYMYHCHLLHHEDDGMMGSFLVVDPFASLGENATNNQLTVYPNPASDEWNIAGNWDHSTVSIEIVNALGQLLFSQNYSDLKEGETIVLPNSGFESGVYFARIHAADGIEQIMTLQKN